MLRVEGDVARTYREGGLIDAGAVFEDRHRGGLGAEVHKHASQTALVVGQHHVGLGQGAVHIAYDVDVGFVGHHSAQHALELLRAAHHGHFGFQHIAVAAHGVHLILAVDAEAHREHIYHVALGVDRGHRLLHQLVDDLACDLRLAGEHQVHIHCGAHHRPASQPHEAAADDARSHTRIVLQALGHSLDGVAHLRVFDHAVAHFVDQALLFGSHHIHHARSVHDAYGPADFRASYLVCHYVAFLFFLSHKWFSISYLCFTLVSVSFSFPRGQRPVPTVSVSTDTSMELTSSTSISSPA